jgi:hypothetical protein
MVKQLTVAALVLVGPGSAWAQVSRTTDAEQIKARQRISTMEGVLERAVMNGADNLLRQVESVMPDAAMLSGQPQVRGFRLDNYGVFFDVEVPALRLSIAWMVKSAQTGSQVASTTLAELKALIARMPPGERERTTVLLQRLELLMGATAPAPPAASSMGLRANTVGAATTARQPVAGPLDIDNPNEAWTREVKSALMEAMLENSNPLAIGDNEWLTVAARDNIPSDPRIPGDSTDYSTVMFRVKGSDLAAFHARRITIDEAKKRVEVTEY